MTVLRTYKPTDNPQLLAWVERIQLALTAAIGGLSWRDNIGPVVEVEYLAANAPIDKRVTARSKPAAIVVLRADNRTDQTSESGCRIKWTMAGDSIRIHAIDVSDTNDTYDVTLGLLMG